MRSIILFALLFIAGSIHAQDKDVRVVSELSNVVEVEHFSEDGIVRETGIYVDGKLHGQWISYAEDGTPIVVAQYHHGVKCGQWFYFDQAKNEMRIVFYSNNEISNVVEMEVKRSDWLAYR